MQMEFPNHFTKSDIFYGTDWSREIEFHFVSAIWDEARGGKFMWPDILDDALDRVINGLYANYGISISYSSCMKRLRILNERLKLFRFIINTPKVFWLQTDNTLSTPFGFWSMVFKINPISQAYVEEGEHLYEKLLGIFGVPSGNIRSPPVCEFSLEELGIEADYISTDTNASAIGPVSLIEIDADAFASARNAKAFAGNPKAFPFTVSPTPVPPMHLFSPGPSDGSASVNSPSLPMNPPVKRLFHD